MESAPREEGTPATSAGHSEKAAICTPGRAPSPGAGGTGILVSDVQPREPTETNVL